MRVPLSSTLERCGLPGPHRQGLGIASLILLALAVAACAGTGTGTTPPEITIKAADYSFDMPETIAGGLVNLTLQGGGKEDHQAQFARLKDGTSLAAFQAALAKAPAAALALVDLAGGPSAVAPNGRQTVTVDLKPGQYVVICFVPGADGVPHVAKGMIKPVTVTAATGGAQAPTAKRTVSLKDFSIDLAGDVSAGSQTWAIRNDGPQPHELSLARLADGKTMADVLAFFEGKAPPGPPPFSSAGGLGAISPGSTGYASLDFKAGNYVALCFVPDPGSGKPHVALGMIAPFTVK